MAVDFPAENIKKILSMNHSKSEIAALSMQKNLSVEAYAMLFSYFKYNKDLVTKKVVSMLGRTPKQAGSAVNRFVSLCKKNGIELSEIKKEEIKPKEKPANKKNKPTKAKNIIENLTPMLDLFSINKKGVTEALGKMEETFSPEALLGAYKTLHILLMAKAKGEVVTKKVSVGYIVTDNGDGTYKKTIAPGKDGGTRIFEETQSYLPDERALAGAMLLAEVIQNMENGNSEYLTQDEQEQRYENYLKKVEQQKIIYQDKEYTEAELLEEEE